MFGALLGIGASLLKSRAQSKAAADATAAQTSAANKGIAEQRRQFNKVQSLLQPYTDAGNSAIGGQLALLGLSGNDAQASAIQGIEQGAQFEALSRQQDNAILQNASATGGLRGGNTQLALADSRAGLLSGLIEQQYSKLGGLTNIGQASAAGVGAAAQNTGNNVSNLLGQIGAAQAGGALAQGVSNSNLFGNIAGGLGQIIGGANPEGQAFNPLFGGQGLGNLF